MASTAPPEPALKSPVYTTDATPLAAAELAHIGKTPGDQLWALALSGGGIRSAAFGMGLLQALVSAGRLTQIDYLSTVSGGGYLGSSLTYFLSQRMPNGQPYGTDKANFPFGRRGEGNRLSEHNNLLDYIRLHGNYLIPGNHLGTAAFIAVLLRTVMMSFAVYFACMTAFFLLLLQVVAADQLQKVSLYFVAGAGAVWLVATLGFSVLTFFKAPNYTIDYRIQALQGKLLSVMVAAACVALLPFIHSHVDEFVAVVPGLLAQDALPMLGDEDYSNRDGAITASFTFFIGVVFSLLTHLRRVGSTEQSISPLQVVVATGLLLFTVVYGAFVAALDISQLAAGNAVMFALIIATLFFGLVCNINFFGLHRMYRNRLMETFMPNAATIKSGDWSLATGANNALLKDMCQGTSRRPYHLINCNIVLVDSSNAKYRGRGGDSFIFSPLYCGSDATGWRSTSAYMTNWFRRGISLPTVMAVSGAAANPDAGVGGLGLTLNRCVATVMSLLNLRLGFWANNPRSEFPWLAPNYLSPGLKGGLLGEGLTENGSMVELSDGGHFENLALYELLRRQVDLIIISDAGADGDFQFADLANAIERARVDFGAKIVFEDDYSFTHIIPDRVMPSPVAEAGRYVLSKRAFAIARIEYRQEKPELPGRVGHLLYLKPTLVDGLSADVISYQKQEPTFPHESTLDQFFNERQFEAYRELGYYLGWQLLENERVLELLDTTAAKTV